MHWIDLAQDRDQGRNLMSTLMNPQVLQMLGSDRMASQLVPS
jgi:hypothetical protein